jgi:hypothetical protein
MFGRFRAKKEVPKDVEVIHIGNEADEGKPQLDVIGCSNDGSKAYGIYSKDRVHIGLFGVPAHRTIAGQK